MDKSTGAGISAQRLEALMDRAIDTLTAILADPAVPARERADIALRLLALGVSGETTGAPVQPVATLLPMQFVSIPDFLSPELHATASATAVQHQDNFVTATVTGNEMGYRQARVLYENAFPALRDAMQREITAVLPAVFTGLARPAFEPTRFELQMTGHGDGDFFKLHSDASAPETATRAITFVYYFAARQPRIFSGGALRLHQTWDGVPQRHEASQFHDVMPADNMIVFFDSHLLHEVLPLQVPSRAFEDGRFTLNGWLHR